MECGELCGSILGLIDGPLGRTSLRVNGELGPGECCGMEGDGGGAMLLLDGIDEEPTADGPICGACLARSKSASRRSREFSHL